MIFYSACIYGANFNEKFRWKSGFLRLGPKDLPTPPPPHQRELKYLGHFSVNTAIMFSFTLI